MVDVNVIREDCTLDEILAELPNRVVKPNPEVKGKNLKKIFHQLSDSLKDIHLQYTCLDASSVAIALGTNVGNAYVYQRVYRKILKISSETKYVSATCIKLASGCSAVAFGHETGTFAVGLVDPPIHKSFDSLTTQDVHHSSITCLEWSSDGLILYAGDNDGKISMSVVKISEGILQTAITVTEDCSVVQLSYADDALAIATTRRTVLWLFQNETIVQVGEKARKMSGGFGCCFIPDNLKEPTKKLYASRPGLRIWTADATGKVSSTSVFKSLLADKPTVIHTLTPSEDKVNSNGQFGKLLVYYGHYITTWDQGHVWVLDLDVGSIIGCHSNLGKIRDVAVCGHEIFVLLNQKEGFLRRFILTTERVLDSSCLDAVVATGEEETQETSLEKTGFDISSALMSVPFMALENEETNVEKPKENAPAVSSLESNLTEVDAQAKNNILDKIAAIPLNEEPLDIVFTAAKPKKKKKKKQKQQPLQAEETERLGETPSGSPDLPRHETTQHEDIGSPKESVIMESISNLETVHPTSAQCHEKLPSVLQETEPQTSAFLEDSSTAQEKFDDKETTDVHTAREQNQEAKSMSDTTSMNEATNEPENVSPSIEDFIRDEGIIAEQETTVESGVIETSIETDNTTTQGVSTIQGTPAPNENSTGQKTLTEQETQLIEPEIPHIEDLESSREDLSDSTDIYRASDDTPRSEEADLPAKDDSKPPEKDYHVPLLVDTWSARSLPTTQTIEHLAISEKYIFCVDNKNRVYFSDPNTASCTGWEILDFKAKQIYVNSSCDFICYVENGKAFVRSGVCEANPVGNASFQILDDVAQLATCSAYTWALTTSDSLLSAETMVLAKLKGDTKSSSIWKREDSVETVCQIACYENVLWGRNLEETVLFYQGRSGGKKTTWKKEGKKAKWLNVSDDGTIWLITPDDQIWFKPHGSSEEVWYQVTLGQYIIDDSSILDSTINFFHSVGSAYRSARTTEYLRHAAKGLLQSTKDMASSLFRDGGSPKQVYCNMQSGVWLLDTRNALHACRGQVTGACWELVCPTGTAKSATWRDVTSGIAGYVWAVQPNGDLTCFHHEGPAYNVENPLSEGSIDFISGSTHGLWCFNTEMNSKVYLRDGINESYPQGFAWTSCSLHQQELKNIRHLSVGRITVWAVDCEGHVWIRVGSVDGDESNVINQAWLPLDCPKNVELASVEVNGKDSMVWAVDTKGGVYAREGVTENFLVGSQWREVEGVSLKSVCLSFYLVYGLCTTGEIVCRFGISEENCVGYYWKKIPGNFPRISVNSAGELWALGAEDKLFARKIKCLVFSREEKSETGDQGNTAEADGCRGNSDNDNEDDEGDWELL